ncbi:cobalamin ABC transporter substrate-binding protein [Sorangium cellulosum]|uniref:Cobalamin ABC transporter substrate-binding protein n=1 Tax=Sorangium cellulosum TaxID=56 RepID=A0A2L0ELF3_SORCE|nr:cobalamin ABC transporter substrate-binding protein [Sorangium cellulosum]AUX40124.1 cobalamin ABC transporter substrate-binding protein [Sorangium cellulosum]
MICRVGAAPLRVALAALAALGLAGGCLAELERPATLADPRSGLLAWEGHHREVFDDNIEPAAVGFSLDGSSPRSDPFLRERAQTADVVARVRVNTVTVDSIGEQSSYHLGIQVGYPPLATPRVADRTFELHIRPTSRAFGIAKAIDARLRGLIFIAFIRRFAGEAGEPDIHWHLSPDTAEVAAAVKEAVALGELAAP